MKGRRSTAFALLITLSLIIGCRDSEKKELYQSQELNSKIYALEEKLNEAHSVIDKLRNENRMQSAELISIQKESQENQKMYEDMQSNYQGIVVEYERFYFSVCNEVKSNYCPSELIYFDPRNLNVGDQLFSMTVSGVEISTFDPTSYIISFQDTAIIFGQYEYEVSQNDPMAPYLRVRTNQINGQDVSIGFHIGGDRERLDEIFLSKSSGDIKLKVDSMVIQRLPYKPAVNGARFVELVKD